MRSQRKQLTTAIAIANIVAFSPSASAQIEEVIVTAQKRMESAQDVPIAVTAFDADSMTDKQITGFADMRFAAPNVSFTKGNFTGSNFSIRGVGSNLVAASGDAGVGVHVNEVPLLSPRLFETEYFDVEQVAVLRGPQGTLYGRNSTGGAINMITNHAAIDDEISANVEGQYGDYSHTKFNGMINIPMGDQFAARFAGIYLTRDGYTDNLFTGNDVDDRDQYALRGSLRWEPGDNTTIDLMASYFEEDSSRSRSQKTLCHNDPTGLLGCLPDKLDFDFPNPSSQFANIFASDAVLGPFGIFELGSNERPVMPRDLREVSSERDPTYESDETLVILKVNHQLDDYSMTMIGSYQDTYVESEMDYQWSIADPVTLPSFLEAVAPVNYAAFWSDGLLPISATSKNATGIIGGYTDGYSAGLEAYDNSKNTTEQYTIEARIQSEYDGPVNFVLGGFYMDADITSEYWVFATGLDYLSAVVPVTAGLDGVGWMAPQFKSDTAEYTVTSTAIFGEVYYEFADTWKLTVGARYTVDEKDITDGQYLLNSTDAGDRLFQPLGVDQPIPIDFRSDDDEWKETTGRVVLDWAVNDDSLLYASFSRGYKGGGFNPPFDPQLFPNTATTFEPEFVDAYEIGSKNIFFDNTLQANITAFFYDYQDMQISKITNRTSFNENTDAEIFGLEVELQWAPDEHWLLSANASYLHSEVQDFTSVDTRDPTGGQDDVTLIQDVPFGNNCVVLMDPDIFRETVGSQFSSCTGLADAGLPVTDGVLLDLDGNDLQNSPEYTVSLGAQYTFNLPQNYLLTVRADYYWQDEMYSRLFNKEIDKIDSWDVWNAQATLNSPDEVWYARAFVKNIGDDDHLVGMYVTDPSSGLFTNVFAIEPRTYGLAIGYNFN